MLTPSLVHILPTANVNSSAIVAAASLIARTLYILGNDNRDSSSSVLSSINVNASLVEELMTCLLDCAPGLSCDLVNSYIVPASVCPSQYVGVIQGDPNAKPEYANDISRFLWNFLADRTSTKRKTAPSSCSQECNNNSEVCIGAETEGGGHCVLSTTR